MEHPGAVPAGRDQAQSRRAHRAGRVRGAARRSVLPARPFRAYAAAVQPGSRRASEELGPALPAGEDPLDGLARRYGHSRKAESRPAKMRQQARVEVEERRRHRQRLPNLADVVCSACRPVVRECGTRRLQATAASNPGRFRRVVASVAASALSRRPADWQRWEVCSDRRRWLRSALRRPVSAALRAPGHRDRAGLRAHRGALLRALLTAAWHRERRASTRCAWKIGRRRAMPVTSGRGRRRPLRADRSSARRFSAGAVARNGASSSGGAFRLRRAGGPPWPWRKSVAPPTRGV